MAARRQLRDAGWKVICLTACSARYGAAYGDDAAGWATKWRGVLVVKSEDLTRIGD
uniref:Uncharacterized protein n=1 Tax=Arundo donax TaxID=35708 RepID=A0A0A9G8R1_ARUDO